MRGGLLSVDWNSPTDLSRREAKLAFLMILCLETALPYGGRVLVDLTSALWTLTAQAQKLRIDPDLWEVLSNPAATPDVTPAQVHFLLAAEELTRQHRRLTADIRETDIRLSF